MALDSVRVRWVEAGGQDPPRWEGPPARLPAHPPARPPLARLPGPEL